MKDVTNKYLNMIESFECDFSLADGSDDTFSLSEIQEQIDSNSNFKLNKDIELLEELSFDLRHGFTKIYDVEY